ncbi:MAG: hypothetical protein ACI4UC_03355, partial [Alloprevotella sp.]
MAIISNCSIDFDGYSVSFMSDLVSMKRLAGGTGSEAVTPDCPRHWLQGLLRGKFTTFGAIFASFFIKKWERVASICPMNASVANINMYGVRFRSHAVHSHMHAALFHPHIVMFHPQAAQFITQAAQKKSPAGFSGGR